MVKLMMLELLLLQAPNSAPPNCQRFGALPAQGIRPAAQSAHGPS